MNCHLIDLQKFYENDSKLKKEDIEELSKWLLNQTHLPELTEMQKIIFLHCANYQIEDAKTIIEKYFTFRTNSDLFKCPSEELIKRTLDVVFMGVLPRKTPEGYSILFTKILDANPQKYNYVEQVQVAMMTMCLHFHQYGPANGIVAVFDVAGMGLGHLFRINFSAAKHVLSFIQEAAPARIIGIHHINTVSIVEHIVGVLKPFMKKEIYNLMKFHSNCSDLYDVVPIECLPKDYGGNLPSIEELKVENLKNLLDNLDFYKWHESQIVKEKKGMESGKEVKSLEID